MRVFGDAVVFFECQVVAVEGGALSQPARTKERRHRRVWARLVTLRKLEQHRLCGYALEGIPLEVRCIGERVAGLEGPLGAVNELLNRHRAGHGIYHRRRLAQRLVFVPRGNAHRDAVQLIDTWAVEQRRHALLQMHTENRSSRRTQAKQLHQRTARNVQRHGLHRGVDRRGQRAVVGAQRESREVGAIGIQIVLVIAVDVDSDLDLPDQLQQIRRGLPQGIPLPQDGVRRLRPIALAVGDDTAAILVNAPPA
jgi:hypothetical protein